MNNRKGGPDELVTVLVDGLTHRYPIGPMRRKNAEAFAARFASEMLRERLLVSGKRLDFYSVKIESEGDTFARLEGQIAVLHELESKHLADKRELKRQLSSTNGER